MQFLHFISAVVIVYVMYYMVVYFLEISKLKKATVKDSSKGTVYTVQVEKQQPQTIAGRTEITEAEVVNIQEQTDDEKKTKSRF